MKRILLAGMKHETNTFATGSTGMREYEDRTLLLGDEAAAYFAGTKTEYGGMLDAAAEDGLELVPVVAADAQPGPKVAREVFDFVLSRITERLAAEAFDGILLVLHGAMVLEDAYDGEGELLSAIRQAAPSVPIVATLDMHCNLTEKMLMNASAFFAYDTYPHIDMYERGYEAGKAMAEILNGKLQPVMRSRRLPLISSSLPTGSEPMKSLMESVFASERKAGVMYMYYIAECLNGSELLEKTSVCLLFNPDEEISSIYSRRLIEETAAKAACAMIIEPARANGALVNARKGIAKYEIFFKGIPAHAGVAPEKGASAINEMFCWGIELNKLNNPAMGTTLNIGVVQGGTEPNVVAENAMCKIDVRITDVKEAERIEARMRELAANPLDARVTVRIEGGVVRPPLNTTAESLALCEKVNAIGKDLGIDVKWVATGGGSDGNFTSALGVPTIDGLGPIGGNTHAATEYGEVASIVPRFNLLLETVKAVLQK